MTGEDESDATETVRRAALAGMRAAGAKSRQELEREHGPVWDTPELRQDFDVIGFLAPLVAVRRKTDGRTGTLTFQHDPRLYFDFVETG
jgi:hypothetical protein